VGVSRREWGERGIQGQEQGNGTQEARGDEEGGGVLHGATEDLP